MHWFWDSCTAILAVAVSVWILGLVVLSFFPFHALSESDLSSIESQTEISFYKPNDVTSPVPTAGVEPPGFRVSAIPGGFGYIQLHADRKPSANKTYAGGRGRIIVDSNSMRFIYITQGNNEVWLIAEKNVSENPQEVDGFSTAKNVTVEVGRLVDEYDETNRYMIVKDLVEAVRSIL